MAASWTVVPAQGALLEEVAAIEAATFGPSAWGRGDVLAAPGAPGALCLCALDRGRRVAGYLFATLVADDLHINTLAVRPDCRRRGVAETLALALLERGRAAGAALCSLEVRASNRGAVALYRKLGFAAAGRRPRFYRAPDEDALILNLRLESDGRSAAEDAGTGN